MSSSRQPTTNCLEFLPVWHNQPKSRIKWDRLCPPLPEAEGNYDAMYQTALVTCHINEATGFKEMFISWIERKVVSDLVYFMSWTRKARTWDSGQIDSRLVIFHGFSLTQSYPTLSFFGLSYRSCLQNDTSNNLSFLRNRFFFTLIYQ